MIDNLDTVHPKDQGIPMKHPATLLKIVRFWLILFLCLSHYLSKSHTTISAQNPGTFYTMYNPTNNTKTNLLYNLDAGIVYKQNKGKLEIAHPHAHSISGSTQPKGNVLGYINKVDGGSTPQRYYIYTKK